MEKEMLLTIAVFNYRTAEVDFHRNVKCMETEQPKEEEFIENFLADFYGSTDDLAWLVTNEDDLTINEYGKEI